MVSNKFPSKDEFLGLVILLLVIGNITLAIMDSSIRPAFTDLTKVALGAYLGLLMPKGGAKQG